MRPASSPTPRPAPAPSCPGSSKLSPDTNSPGDCLCLAKSRAAGPWLPAPALRRVRARQAAGVQLQAARFLPVVRRPAHVTDGSAPGGPRRPARAGAPVGPVAADPAARAAGRAARAGHAGAAGGAAGGRAASAGPHGAQERRRSGRRRHPDPALRLGSQPEHPSALPGAGRRVPLRRRRRAQLRRGGCAHRRGTACAAADRHRPADEGAHAPGRAGRGHGPDLAGRAGCRRRGGAHAAAAAGGGHHLSHAFGADASSKPSRTATIGHPCVSRASHRLPETV